MRRPITRPLTRALTRAALPVAVLTAGVLVAACTSGSAHGGATFSVPALPTISASTSTSGSPSPSATHRSTRPSPVHRAAPAPSSSSRSTHVANGVQVGPTYRPIGLIMIKTSSGAYRRECSASVVDSTGGDIVLTAGHCYGAAHPGSVFVPDYNVGSMPFGTWTVTRSYTAPQWQYGRNPAYDYLFLRVVPTAGSGASAPVQQVVGGERLGVSPAAGTRVAVIGYSAPDQGRARTCGTTLSYQGAYPLVHCAGYGSYTSGSPFLTDFDARTGIGTVVGAIGGPHGGGCGADESLSPPFGSAIESLLREAEAGGPSSPYPTGGTGEGC